MRSVAFIAILALVTFNGFAQAQIQSSDQAGRILSAGGQQTGEAIPYDLTAHQERIDVLFQRYIPGLLTAEREKIEALLPKEKAVTYMEFFERGMRAETGSIMLNTGESYWLELAYREGYAQKVLFRSGYFLGLAEGVE